MSIIYSIINQKCPRCREGNLWHTPLLPKFKLYDMYEECPVCKIHYETEPEVWYGAMIIAYAISSVVLLVTAYIAFGILDLQSWQGYSLILIVALLGFAINARLSRTIWIHFMIHYDPNILTKQAAIKQQVAQGATVIDVRSKKEFAQGHNPTALNMPIYNLLDNLDNIKQIKSPIVLVCQTGSKAAQAMEILQNNGIKQVTNGGGWNELT